LDEKVLPPIIDGKQVIRMKASSYGYYPNYFKVKVGVPVRWEIEDVGTSGCTNAIISKGLFPDEITLTPGQISVKEFIPEKPGKYKFSCWMGMVSGIIEVVDKGGVTSQNNVSNGDGNLFDMLCVENLGRSCDTKGDAVAVAAGDKMAYF